MVHDYKHGIFIREIYQGRTQLRSFEDYKKSAEAMAFDKMMPATFEYGGYLYTVEKKP